MVNLADEDLGLLTDAITKVAKSSLKGISKKNLWLTNQLVEHINQLTEAINKVKATVEVEDYGVDPSSH